MRIRGNQNLVTAENIASPPAIPATMRGSEMDQAVVPAYDGIYAWSFRYPTFSTDTVLATRGYKFVEDMLNMSSCRAIFDLKRLSVLQDGWDVEPAIVDYKQPGAEDAKKLADDLTYALNNIRNPVTDLPQDFRNVLFSSMMASWSGNRFCEIVWNYFDVGEIAGKHGFRGFWDKPNEQMAFDVDPDTLELINATSYTPSTGYNFGIPMEKMVYFVHAPQRNDPHGIGDWRACYKHWFRLDNNLKFWAVALERWGAPVLLLKYPAGNQEAMTAANKAANNIRQGSNAVIPNNVEHELVNAPSGVFTAMKEAAEYDSRQMSLVIHANILSTGEGEHGSTSAGAKEHGQVGSTIYDSLSISCEGVWNQQMVHRFVRYNYGDKALVIAPKLRLRKRNTDDAAATAQVISILHSIQNLPSRSKVIRDKLGWPPLDAEDEKMLDDEKKAMDEAQQQVADQQQQGAMQSLQKLKQRDGAPGIKTLNPAGANKMGDAQYAAFVTDLADVIAYRNNHADEIKKLAATAQW